MVFIHYEGRITEQKGFGQRQGSLYWSGCSQRELPYHSTGGRRRIFLWRYPHSQYHALRKLLGYFKDCRIKVAYEAGPCGFRLYERLTEDGIETIVVPPSLIPIESGNKVKTDKRDTRKLAKLLEGHMLKKVYVLSEADRADRELLRTRRPVLEHRNDVARQIKSK